MDTPTTTEQEQERPTQDEDTAQDDGPPQADPRLMFFVGKAAKQPSKRKRALPLRETTKTD